MKRTPSVAVDQGFLDLQRQVSAALHVTDRLQVGNTSVTSERDLSSIQVGMTHDKLAFTISKAVVAAIDTERSAFEAKIAADPRLQEAMEDFSRTVTENPHLTFLSSPGHYSAWGGKELRRIGGIRPKTSDAVYAVQERDGVTRSFPISDLLRYTVEGNQILKKHEVSDEEVAFQRFPSIAIEAVNRTRGAVAEAMTDAADEPEEDSAETEPLAWSKAMLQRLEQACKFSIPEKPGSFEVMGVKSLSTDGKAGTVIFQAIKQEHNDHNNRLVVDIPEPELEELDLPLLELGETEGFYVILGLVKGNGGSKEVSDQYDALRVYDPSTTQIRVLPWQEITKRQPRVLIIDDVSIARMTPPKKGRKKKRGVLPRDDH